MLFMNQYEVEDAVNRFDRVDTPNLSEGAGVLCHLMEWTNNNSDGWAYWVKPLRSATKLMTLLQGVDRFDPRPKDVSPAALKAACTPIKAFLTRQGVARSEVFKPLNLKLL